MPTCSAFGCRNRSSGSKKKSEVTFHRFPKNSKQRNAWIVAVRRKNWTSSRCSSLCSAHFSEDQIDRTSVSSVRLRENAVPNIFEEYPSHLQSGVKKTSASSLGSDSSVDNDKDQQSGNTADLSLGASSMIYNSGQQSTHVSFTDIGHHSVEIEQNSNEVDKKFESLGSSEFHDLDSKLESVLNDVKTDNMKGNLEILSSNSIESVKMQIKLINETGSVNKTAVPLLQDNFSVNHDNDQHSQSPSMPFTSLDQHLTQSHSNKVDKNVAFLVPSDFDSKLENMLSNMKNKSNLIGNLENLSNDSIESLKIQIKLLKEAGAGLLYE